MADAPSTGDLIAGRYRLGAALGQGGMSRVYRAVDEALGREVAVKLLREPLAEHAGRFEREARTMGRLRHPAVVKVYGYGLIPVEVPDAPPAAPAPASGEGDTIAYGEAPDDRPPGLPYLVLELVHDAISLATLLERRGPMAAREAIRLMRPVAGALAEAHDHGIVHRDLKPDNVLLQSAAGLAPLLRLIDFGIAAWDTPDAQRLTQTGQVFGTPAYMAPEHASGAFGAGPAADVWAIGVMLYEMVSGVCPFRGPHVTATLFNITTREPPPLDDVPPAFQALVDDCLKKDPAARLPDAAAVLDRLTALADEGIDAEAAPAGSTLASDELPAAVLARSDVHTMTVSPPPAVAARRGQWIVGGVGAAAGLVLGVALGWLAGGAPAPTVAAAGTPVELAVATPPALKKPASPVGPPPLVDGALDPAARFLAAGDADRALEWLDAHPDAGHADARERLAALALLARGEIEPALARLDALLTRRPALAGDEAVAEAVLAVLGEREAEAAGALLGVMLPAHPALEARVIELTDHDDYRTRKRALRVIEQSGHDVEAATLRFYVRNLRVLDCDLRRQAVDELRALGDPAAIGPIKAMDARTGFFDNLCMDGAIDRALGALYAAERRQARSDRAGADAGGADAGAD